MSGDAGTDDGAELDTTNVLEPSEKKNSPTTQLKARRFPSHRSAQMQSMAHVQQQRQSTPPTHGLTSPLTSSPVNASMTFGPGTGTATAVAPPVAGFVTLVRSPNVANSAAAMFPTSAGGAGGGGSGSSAAFARDRSGGSLAELSAGSQATTTISGFPTLRRASPAGVSPSSPTGGLPAADPRVSVFFPRHVSEDDVHRSGGGVGGGGGVVGEASANDDRMQVRVDGYFGSDTGFLIPNELPKSTLLYILTASDGRDLLFKTIQYSLQLFICILKTPSLFAPESAPFLDAWAVQLWRNYNTIRHGRSLFKMGRGVINLFTLQTVCERLWMRYGGDLTQQLQPLLTLLVTLCEPARQLGAALGLPGLSHGAGEQHRRRMFPGEAAHADAPSPDDSKASSPVSADAAPHATSTGWLRQWLRRLARATAPPVGSPTTRGSLAGPDASGSRAATAARRGSRAREVADTLLDDNTFLHVARVERPLGAGLVSPTQRLPQGPASPTHALHPSTTTDVHGRGGAAFRRPPLTPEPEAATVETAAHRTPFYVKGEFGTVLGGTYAGTRSPPNTSFGSRGGAAAVAAAAAASAAAAVPGSATRSAPVPRHGGYEGSIYNLRQRTQQSSAELTGAAGEQRIGPGPSYTEPSPPSPPLTHEDTFVPGTAAGGGVRGVRSCLVPTAPPSPSMVLADPLARSALLLGGLDGEQQGEEGGGPPVLPMTRPQGDARVELPDILGTSTTADATAPTSSVGGVGPHTSASELGSTEPGGLARGEGRPPALQASGAAAVDYLRTSRVVPFQERLADQLMGGAGGGGDTPLGRSRRGGGTGRRLSLSASGRSFLSRTGGRPSRAGTRAGTEAGTEDRGSVSLATSGNPDPTVDGDARDENGTHARWAGDGGGGCASAGTVAAAGDRGDAPTTLWSPHPDREVSLAGSSEDGDDADVGGGGGGVGAVGARYSPSSFAFPSDGLEPATAAEPARWRKGPMDFNPILISLVGVRNLAAAVRRFMRDMTLISSERFFTFDYVENNRVTIHRRINYLWLMVSVLDLLLNTIRLARPGWAAYVAARQNPFCRCGCRGGDDPEDLVWRSNGMLTRQKKDLVFPPLDLDHGAPYASNIAYVEAADPVHMRPACRRCGFLYKEVADPTSRPQPEAERPPRPLPGNAEGSAARVRGHHWAAVMATPGARTDRDGSPAVTAALNGTGEAPHPPPPATSMEGGRGGPAGQWPGRGVAATGVPVRAHPGSGEVPIGFLLLPSLMWRLFNYVWLLRVHPNLTSAFLLQLRYTAELFLAYKYCFGNYEPSRTDAPLYQILNPGGAVAGLVSAAVGLLRVVESAPK